jgi:tRNA pseudouridine32 synthase/23S rRNA pseudouridine746 synthase
MNLAVQPPVRLMAQHPGCIVLHKPPGVPFHAAEGRPGLMQLVRQQQGEPHLAYDGPLWPVHRLDQLTSGALVLATSREAAGELVAQFRGRGVSKYYVALSDRKPAKKMGSITGDMQRSRRGSWMLSRSTHNPAITRFTSAAVAGCDGRPLRAFLLKPVTGRTHQLRVALKSLGSPVLGDERYAAAGAAAQEDRAYLHCAAMRFSLGGRPVQVVCPPAHGREFAAEAFQQQFEAWLPLSLEEDVGPWFPDSKLLRSELDVGQ